MGKYTESSKNAIAQSMFSSCPGFDLNAGALSDILNAGLYEIIEEKDIEQFTSKGCWYNLPDGLDGDTIERILYYKGRGVFFYMKTIDKFYFLPFALAGNTDVVGKYLDVTPVIFGGSNKDENSFIDGLIVSPIYQILIPEQVTEEVLNNGCVILNDRTQKRSQNIKPRADLQKPLIELEANIVTLLRTAIMNKVGIKGVKSSGPEDSTKIIQASKSKWLYALAGYTYLPIENGFESLDIDDTTSANIQEMFMALNAIDNLRLDNLGILNGGVFEKQGTVLQTEANFGISATQLIENSYVKQRQNFCNIVNSIWGLNIWYEPLSALNEFEPSNEQEDPNQSTTQMYDEEQTGNDQGGTL